MSRTSLIITPFPPLHPSKSFTGIFRRLRMFASSLSKVSDHVRLFGLVPASEVAAATDWQGLSEALAREWGLTIEIALFPSRTREKTAWNEYVPGLLSIGEQPGFYHYGGPEQIEAVRHELERKPDILFVHRLSAMIPVFRSGIRPPRIYFDLDDVEHRVRLREASLRAFSAGKMAALAQIPAILGAERQAIRWARKTFVCSEPDRRHLGLIADLDRIATIHNAVDMPPPRPPTNPAPNAEPNILFLGDLKHGPNHIGAERLLRHIWPLIRAQRPDAHLIVAGPGPEGLPSFGQPHEGVEFTGFVPDLGALYDRARIVICPLVTGGGTRIKLIEAAAFHKPIVSTEVGAENLGLADGVEILLRNTDQSLAEACVQLLADPDRGATLAAAAYRKVAATYSRPEVEQAIMRNLHD